MTARVCFVCPRAYGYFDPEQGFTGGGAERQIYLLSTALADRFDVHVVVGDYGQLRREHREGVTLHRAYPLQDRQSPLQPVKHLGILARAMGRADADAYVFRGNPRNAGFVWLVTRLLRRPWVYHVANDDHIESRPGTLPAPVGKLFETALGRAAVVVAQTDRQQALLGRKYGLDATVVPNGYPPASAPLPATDREYLLWVGRLHEREKRPHLYLDLAERLPELECRLVGPVDEGDPYEQRIAERARELDNVTMCGEVSPREIHEQYRRAIALVSTSRHEGFPNVFLEAWRQATPVASLAVDPGRFLGAEVPACHADGSMDRLAEVCTRLATDTAYASEVGTAVREHFEATYSMTAVTDRYADAVRAVL